MAARGQDQILTIQGVQSFNQRKTAIYSETHNTLELELDKKCFFFVIFVIGYLGVWLRPYLKVEEM